MNKEPTLDDIQQAAARIAHAIHQTPVLTCESLNQMVQASLFFKCENFQKVGAFKFRGATNAVLSLPTSEAKQGVATHSSGNHAQALALAARQQNLKAYIVMPDNAPNVKIAAVRGYGADIHFCEPTLQAREETLAAVVEKTGAVFVHPYNDERVIAGQATASLELLAQCDSLDQVLVPVGGGGLLSGTAIAVSQSSPSTQVIAVEPEMANDAFLSFKQGKRIPVDHPQTIADGLRTSLGDKTFPIIQRHVHDIVTVSEAAIIQAMFLIWERMKIIIEPSSAVPFAALLEKKIEFAHKKIGIILSGGNVDLRSLPWK